MKNTNSKDPLEIGSRLFYLCWIVSLIFVVVILFSDVFDLSIIQRYFLIIVIIGIIIFPFVKSVNIGNLLKIEVNEVKKSIVDLKDRITTLQISNIRNVQQVQINTTGAHDENFQASTLYDSKIYYIKAEDLRKNRQFLDSLIDYHKAFELDKNNWLAAFSLGAVYLSLKDFRVDSKKWGFDENERLSRAIFFSQYATQMDRGHFGQFMNLGIAQQHLGGETSLELSIRSFNEACKILDRDPNLLYTPQLITAKGKCIHFKAMSLAKLNRKEEAKKYDKEAIETFNSCPEPVPPELPKWLKQAKDHLGQLK